MTAVWWWILQVVPTGTVSVTHLHCVEHLDEAGTGLRRLSLLLQRLETACLNFIHIMFYKQLEGFFPVINRSELLSFSCVPS